MGLDQTSDAAARQRVDAVYRAESRRVFATLIRILGGDFDLAEEAMVRDELRHVVSELGRLPERQRLALVQRELCGTSHAELADQLGTTVSATKSLIIRARTQLRTAHAA